MNIGMVAQESGVPSRTIRYYESIGLIRPAERSANGYRIYGNADVHMLRFVHRARRLGFTIADVATLLSLWRNSKRSIATIRAIASERIRQIDRKVRELEAMRRALRDFSKHCQRGHRPDGPIIAESARVEDERHSPRHLVSLRRGRVTTAHGVA